MKKEYKKPTIGLFPTKCHVSSLSPYSPEGIDHPRRNLLIRGGLFATVGHLSLYGGTGGGDDEGPKSMTTNSWTGEPIKK